MSKVAVAVLAGLLLVGPAGAQESEERAQFKEMFEELMAERVAELAEEGVRLKKMHDLWVDSLHPGLKADHAVARKKFRFSGGADGKYVLVAFCDEDCYDIDLHLWREGQAKGPRLSDTEEDAEPLLVSGLFDRGLEDGDYQVEVRMYDCRTYYCYFAVGLYFVPE